MRDEAVADASPDEVPVGGLAELEPDDGPVLLAEAVAVAVDEPVARGEAGVVLVRDVVARPPRVDPAPAELGAEPAERRDTDAFGLTDARLGAGARWVVGAGALVVARGTTTYPQMSP
ncbi:MAG: hypothetical protein ABJA87_09420 [bacterium]